MSPPSFEISPYNRSDTVEVNSEPIEFDAALYSQGQQSVTIILSDIPDDFLAAMAEYQAGNLLDLDQVLEEGKESDSV